MMIKNIKDPKYRNYCHVQIVKEIELNNPYNELGPYKEYECLVKTSEEEISITLQLYRELKFEPIIGKHYYVLNVFDSQGVENVFLPIVTTFADSKIMDEKTFKNTFVI